MLKMYLCCSKLLLRHASQCSLDESSQKEPSQVTTERQSYHNSEHFLKAFHKLNNMRKYDNLQFILKIKITDKSGCLVFRENVLCDVVLVVKDQEFSAHKTLLAACSPYFNAMFSCFEESKQKQVQLQDVDPKALSLILDYVYTAEVQVSEDNVQVLNTL